MVRQPSPREDIDTAPLLAVPTNDLDGSFATRRALRLPAGLAATVVAWTGQFTVVLAVSAGISENGTLVRCNVLTSKCERAGKAFPLSLAFCPVEAKVCVQMWPLPENGMGIVRHLPAG